MAVYKNRTKKRKIKKKALFFGILFLIIFLFVLCFSVKIIKKRTEKEVHQIEETDTYTLKIDYPIFHIKKVDEKIKTYVDKKRDEFLEINEKVEKPLTSKYDFLLNVTKGEYQDLLNVHMNTLSYTGGAHYMRDDESFHYNKKTKQFMELSDFFKDKESFDKIDDLAYRHLTDLKKEDGNSREIWLRRGIAPDNVNYQHFMFKKSGLEILFPPYQIGPWSDGEIKITIPYQELNPFLKEQYKGKTKETKEEILIPQIRDLTKYKDKKLIAFTFDDGPNTSTTNLLLDSLDQYDARVTFFVLGNRIDSNQEVLKKAFLQGNQIGSHTYNHKNLFVLKQEDILKEINDTNEKIKEVIGEYPTLIRPPYGNTNQKIKQLSNLYTILWDIGTLDWKYKNAEKICEEIIKNAYDGAIVLLHDIYESSVRGALMTMEQLSKEGYAFVNIEEMAALKNKDLNYEETYYHLK